jgi:CBS domain-containing protein
VLESRRLSELPVVDAEGRPLGLLDIVDLVGIVPADPAAAATGDVADVPMPLPGNAAA